MSAPAAYADAGDVTTADVGGTWTLTVLVQPYTTQFNSGAVVAGSPPAGTQTEQQIVFVPTCTAPGQCSLIITDTDGNSQFVGASGFVGPNPSVTMAQTGADIHSGDFGGFGGGPCNDADTFTPFAPKLDFTITAATLDGTDNHATGLTGSETVVVIGCSGGHLTTAYRHLLITQAVFVPPPPITTPLTIPISTPLTTPATPPITTPAASTSPSTAVPAVPVATAPPKSGGRTQSFGATRGPAPIATALPVPHDAFHSLTHAATNAVIAAAVVLLIVFPSELFNKTFDENYDEIRAWWDKRLRWLGNRRLHETDAQKLKRGRITFAVVVLAGAVLGGLLNPRFGFNIATMESLLAALIAFVFAATVGGFIGYRYRKFRHLDLAAIPRALPAGLAIATVCVLVSRLADFQPGYLYGVICAIVFTAELDKREAGQVVAIQASTTLVIAVIAWFLWVPVNHAAVHPHAAFPIVVLDDLLGSLFVGGLVGTVIGMFPLRFMPGHKLISWHRGAWAAVFGVAVFGLMQAMLRPSTGLGHPGHAPLVTAIVLFVVFGGASVVFAAYFNRRKRRIAVTPPA